MELLLTTMNICIALNRKYIRYACVMLTSLFVNNETERIHVYALNCELTDEDVALFEDFCESYGNEFFDIKVDAEKFDKRLPVNEKWTRETLFRLALIDLLPNTLDRILYLDIDMIVQKDISALYYADFNGKYFIATPDIATKMPITPNDKRYPLFKDFSFQERYYFNAGMMIWNLKELRGGYSLQTYLDKAAEFDYNIPALDQDLLNLVHWDEVFYVDPYKYDCFTTYSKEEIMDRSEELRFEEAFIIHYAGPKPWNNQVQCQMNEIWWEYAKQTPYYIELMEDFVINGYNAGMTTDIMTYYRENDKLRATVQKIKDCVLSTLQNLNK